MGGSTSTNATNTISNVLTDNSNTGNVGSNSNSVGNLALNLSGSTGTSNISVVEDSAPALALAGTALQGANNTVLSALEGESKIASGALQFSSGLATQGANLAGQSNVGGALTQLITPVLIAIAVIAIAYFAFK